MDYVQQLADLKKIWLRGTTCWPNYTSVDWVHESGRYVLMKHRGHASYVSRGDRTTRCPTCFCLYDLANLPEIDIFGKPALGRWEGRWFAKYDKEIDKIIMDADFRENLPKVALYRAEAQK